MRRSFAESTRRGVPLECTNLGASKTASRTFVHALDFEHRFMQALESCVTDI